MENADQAHDSNPEGKRPEPNKSSSSSPPDDLVTVHLVDIAEMAHILGVHKSWLYERTRFNQIPCVRLGRYVRFEPHVVLAHFKEKHATQSRA